MPTDPGSRRQPRQSRGGGGFWLGLAIVVGGIGAVYVFAPQIPRRLLGGGDRPGLGDEPVTAQSSTTQLETREQSATNALTQPSALARTSTSAAPVAPVSAPAAPIPVAKAFADEAKAQTYLTQAEAAYKAAPALKDWSQASSAARKIIGLNVKPATLVRAKDIIRGSEAMAKLFKDLDDRDELQRNYDTDPQLVLIGTGPSASFAVPVTSMDTPEVVKGDPLQWITNQRKTGKVTVLLRGKKDFIPATLPSDQVGSIEHANVAEIVADRQREFDERLARLKNSALADNALAWYDAAKFAYQNRLDDTVAAMMDRALILDPLLAQSVREDKAAGLFANVVLHLNNSNTKQAAAFMKILAERFSDTPSGQQARAFYDSKTKQGADEVAKAQEALRAARRAAMEREAEEARNRKEQRVARAKESGDEKEMAAAEKAPASDAGDVDAAAPAASGDEGKADDLYAKGRDLYSKAIDAGNTSARDQLYEECNKYLTQAQGIYNQLVEKNPGNTALEEKAFMCNKLRYGSIKQRRFH
jgi:hypothetical protein